MTQEKTLYERVCEFWHWFLEHDEALRRLARNPRARGGAKLRQELSERLATISPHIRPTLEWGTQEDLPVLTLPLGGNKALYYIQQYLGIMGMKLGLKDWEISNGLSGMHLDQFEDEGVTPEQLRAIIDQTMIKQDPDTPWEITIYCPHINLDSPEGELYERILMRALSESAWLMYFKTIRYTSELEEGFVGLIPFVKARKDDTERPHIPYDAFADPRAYKSDDENEDTERRRGQVVFPDLIDEITGNITPNEQRWLPELAVAGLHFRSLRFYYPGIPTELDAHMDSVIRPLIYAPMPVMMPVCKSIGGRTLSIGTLDFLVADREGFEREVGRILENIAVDIKLIDYRNGRETTKVLRDTEALTLEEMDQGGGAPLYILTTLEMLPEEERNTYNNRMIRGRALMHAQVFDRAVEVLEECVSEQPDDPQAIHQLAYAARYVNYPSDEDRQLKARLRALELFKRQHALDMYPADAAAFIASILFELPDAAAHYDEAQQWLTLAKQDKNSYKRNSFLFVEAESPLSSEDVSTYRAELCKRYGSITRTVDLVSADGVRVHIHYFAPKARGRSYHLLITEGCADFAKEDERGIERNEFLMAIAEEVSAEEEIFSPESWLMSMFEDIMDFAVHNEEAPLRRQYLSFAQTNVVNADGTHPTAMIVRDLRGIVRNHKAQRYVTLPSGEVVTLRSITPLYREELNQVRFAPNLEDEAQSVYRLPSIVDPKRPTLFPIIEATDIDLDNMLGWSGEGES